MLKMLRKGTGSATLHDYLRLTTREVCRDYSLSRPAPREQPSFRFPTSDPSVDGRLRSKRREPALDRKLTSSAGGRDGIALALSRADNFDGPMSLRMMRSFVDDPASESAGPR
jgi:hypothetical protein